MILYLEDLRIIISISLVIGSNVSCHIHPENTTPGEYQVYFDCPSHGQQIVVWDRHCVEDCEWWITDSVKWDTSCMDYDVCSHCNGKAGEKCATCGGTGKYTP